MTLSGKKSKINFEDNFKKIRSYKNYFLWNLYFADLLGVNSGFDIIITNPPYVKERENKEKFIEVKKNQMG